MELDLRHERIDDLPVIFAMAGRMKLAETLEEHLGRHGNHRGLGYGKLAMIWLAYILAEGDHRKSTVQEWAENRKVALGKLVGETLRPADLSDDRLGNLLRRLADEKVWAPIERALWQASAFVYDLTAVRLDTTTSYGYHQSTEDGLMQLGHSKDHRPDLAQIKLMAAVAEPSGQVMCTQVYSGERADDGLYVPMIERVRQMTGQRGLLYIGDAKMASLETRATIAFGQDHYLTRLPKTGRAQEREAWVKAIVDGRQVATLMWQDGELVGAGYEFVRAQTASAPAACWEERVICYRSRALAERQIADLQERMAAAKEAILALTPPPGRGRRQFRDPKALAKAVSDVQKRFRVSGFFLVSWDTEPDPARADPDRQRLAIADVFDRPERISKVRDRLGWLVLVTTLPTDEFTLAQVVELYNRGWVIEGQFHNLKDRPLGIQPLWVMRDDQIAGLTYLLTLALRLLTLITTQVRGSLAKLGQSLKGLYEGQPSRVTSQPTGRRCLKAFYRTEITLTRIRAPGQELWHITPLTDVLASILSHLGLSHDIYTNLATPDNTHP